MSELPKLTTSSPASRVKIKKTVAPQDCPDDAGGGPCKPDSAGVEGPSADPGPTAATQGAVKSGEARKPSPRP
jgi:hypothetical protein